MDWVEWNEPRCFYGHFYDQPRAIPIVCLEVLTLLVVLFMDDRTGVFYDQLQSHASWSTTWDLYNTTVCSINSSFLLHYCIKTDPVCNYNPAQ